MARAKTKKTGVVFLGIYFVLFGSSIKVLLSKRKAISGTTPLLAITGVLGILITWVSISYTDPLLSGDDSHWAVFPPPFPR
jgi:xanthosine utilization system XapX-like protein